MGGRPGPPVACIVVLDWNDSVTLDLTARIRRTNTGELQCAESLLSDLTPRVAAHHHPAWKAVLLGRPQLPHALEGIGRHDSRRPFSPVGIPSQQGCFPSERQFFA